MQCGNIEKSVFSIYKTSTKLYKMHGLLRTLLLLSLTSVILTNERQCLFQDTCERCLGADMNCAWCTDKIFETRYRCSTRAELLSLGCSPNSIYENEPNSLTLKDSNVKDYEGVNDMAVQVQPQKVFLKLVKSHTQQIKLKYRPARNNPLDLYVLMDLTWTMRDDKETLVKLGADLPRALRNLTANYRLGFGSYADKPIEPFINKATQKNPCAAERVICEPTYGYRHHLPLTQDIHSFVRSVNESRITANLDNLEGGMDALMQVLVCTTQIGWMEKARKIVILVTDGYMHFAGDGLLAGIVQRNDKQCHLSVEGDYLGSLEYDYPSLEEIYRELLRRKVGVIFAVTSDVVGTYREMSNLMQEISNVEILSADSSNILELIRSSYETFIKRAQFTDNSPDFIKLDYFTDCGGKYNSVRKRNYCSNVEMGKEVDFYINVTLTDFPKDDVYTYKLRVEESTLNEFMEIEVEVQKPCPCVEKADPLDVYGRFQCNEQGYLECGMCECDEGWTGRYCTCSMDGTNVTSNEALEKLCRRPLDEPDALGPICSNRGECDCGDCVCAPGYNGRFCECPECDSYCDPERATCVCGLCVCKYGWSGNRCNCDTSLEGCVGPTGETCSGRGFCNCGACNCDDPYKGEFCEIGTGDENKLCTFYEPCVSCMIEEYLHVGKCENSSQICFNASKDLHFTHKFVEEELDAEVRCLVRLQNKHGITCDHYFTYKQDTYKQDPSSHELRIKVNNDCEPLNYYALFSYIGLATFLLGLALICCFWYCLRLKDNREYMRFEADQQNSINMNNPLYEDPIREYKVPDQLNERHSSQFHEL